jgi:hypothetical protein
MIYQTLLFIMLVTIPFIVIASDSSYDTENEPTPIRYINCDSLGNNCFVDARALKISNHVSCTRN